MGKTYIAKSNSSKLLSYLRANQQETVLVLINMDDKPVSGCIFSLATGPLSGNYTVTSLTGETSAYNALQANAKGGLDKYVPIEEVPPYSVTILQLNQQ